MTSELDIHQTNASTWHWTGIGGLPKRFPCGIIPVAVTSLHKISNVSSSRSAELSLVVHTNLDLQHTNQVSSCILIHLWELLCPKF